MPYYHLAELPDLHYSFYDYFRLRCKNIGRFWLLIEDTLVEKYFLATISNEVEHLFGVRFICTFFNKMSENRVTLLHICKGDSVKKTLTSSWDNPKDISSALIPPEVKKTIQKAQKFLNDSKVPVDHVMIKTVAEKYGKVKDILAESAQGQYDAIVLGRRASYALQWMFDRPSDETFQAMTREHSCVSPLWICPDIDPGRKNALLCIDGSESGYRAVDHVGYILSDQEQHNIMLLHVENNVATNCVGFFEKAVSILLSHNIHAKRIKRSVIWGLSISGTILSESQEGKYAVVAMGMSGQKKGKAKMAGATTTKVISKLEKTSLWCCP